jgi:hypothetical protein
MQAEHVHLRQSPSHLPAVRLELLADKHEHQLRLLPLRLRPLRLERLGHALGQVHVAPAEQRALPRLGEAVQAQQGVYVCPSQLLRRLKAAATREESGMLKSPAGRETSGRHAVWMSTASRQYRLKRCVSRRGCTTTTCWVIIDVRACSCALMHAAPDPGLHAVSWTGGATHSEFPHTRSVGYSKSGGSTPVVVLRVATTTVHERATPRWKA